MLRPLLIFGTRPEAVKMAPVAIECRRREREIDAVACSTGQHPEMVEEVVEWFGVCIDERLSVMVSGQPLSLLAARCLTEIDSLIERREPHCVVAAGDTTTVLCSALGAFHRRLPFVHVEAGLRTGNVMAPWPEELNRMVADAVPGLRCAPTARAETVLRESGVPGRDIRLTGNTVIDALFWTVERQDADASFWQERYWWMRDWKKVVLVTAHRRENFGRPLENIYRAVSMLAEQFRDYLFVCPVHPNPNVREPAHALLSGRTNVYLLPPIPYQDFVWLIRMASLILTDSGGIQEEAPSLGKPVLVMRDATERPEAVEAGSAKLVGTSPATILQEACAVLTGEETWTVSGDSQRLFGDGHAADRIVGWILEQEWTT